MSNNDYLREVLRAQEVQPGSTEMKELENARADVEALLRREFADCSPTIRYGGSKMKNTMNLEDYDLDIICYFPRDDTPAETIKEIYDKVLATLGKEYEVNARTTALRVIGAGVDLKVDVVPGRFIDATEKDAYVHQNGGDKKYLKTNLDCHIAYVRDSGRTGEVRLMKLWRTCVGIKVRTFPLELLVIKILKGVRVSGLENRLTYVLTEIRDNIDNIAIEDPANGGNDLSDALDTNTRRALAFAAKSTHQTVENAGWEPVFRKIMGANTAAREDALRVTILRNEPRTPPWRSK